MITKKLFGAVSLLAVLGGATQITEARGVNCMFTCSGRNADNHVRDFLQNGNGAKISACLRGCRANQIDRYVKDLLKESARLEQMGEFLGAFGNDLSRLIQSDPNFIGKVILPYFNHVLQKVQDRRQDPQYRLKNWEVVNSLNALSGNGLWQLSRQNYNAYAAEVQRIQRDMQNQQSYRQEWQAPQQDWSNYNQAPQGYGY